MVKKSLENTTKTKYICLDEQNGDLDHLWSVGIATQLSSG